MSPAKSHRKRKQARERFWRRYKGPMVCAHCAVPVFRDVLPTALNKATVDHIKPLALGGSNHRSNLRLLCFKCNTQTLNQNIQNAPHNRPSPITPVKRTIMSRVKFRLRTILLALAHRLR